MAVHRARNAQSWNPRGAPRAGTAVAKGGAERGPGHSAATGRGPEGPRSVAAWLLGGRPLSLSSPGEEIFTSAARALVML